MNQNARLKIVIEDDEANFSHDAENKEVYELRRNNDVTAKDIEIAH